MAKYKIKNADFVIIFMTKTLDRMQRKKCSAQNQTDDTFVRLNVLYWSGRVWKATNREKTIENMRVTIRFSSHAHNETCFERRVAVPCNSCVWCKRFVSGNVWDGWFLWLLRVTTFVFLIDLFYLIFQHL